MVRLDHGRNLELTVSHLEARLTCWWLVILPHVWTMFTSRHPGQLMSLSTLNPSSALQKYKGPEFSRSTFAPFAESYGFHHITSSLKFLANTGSRAQLKPLKSSSWLLSSSDFSHGYTIANWVQSSSTLDGEKTSHNHANAYCAAWSGSPWQTSCSSKWKDKDSHECWVQQTSSYRPTVIHHLVRMCRCRTTEHLEL